MLHLVSLTTTAVFPLLSSSRPSWKLLSFFCQIPISSLCSPALKHPGIPIIHQTKPSLRSLMAKPLTAWPFSLYSALYSCQGSPFIPHHLPNSPCLCPAPGMFLPNPLQAVEAPAVGGSTLLTAHAELGWWYLHSCRLGNVGSHLSACRNCSSPKTPSKLLFWPQGPLRLFSPSVSAN